MGHRVSCVVCTALALALLSAPPAAAENGAASINLGTVLYTRAERKMVPAQAAASGAARGTSDAKNTSHRFDGYAKPERGPAVVWINGQADTPADVVLERTGEVIVRVNRQHGRVLKAGQTDNANEFADGNSVVLHAADPPTQQQRSRAAAGRADRDSRSN